MTFKINFKMFLLNAKSFFSPSQGCSPALKYREVRSISESAIKLLGIWLFEQTSKFPWKHCLVGGELVGSVFHYAGRKDCQLL